jgi:AraC family ethanolamine operon transcriptional activator
VIRNRDVVHECIEYGDALGRRPSIPELCAAAHISERRLRTAFYDTFNVAPSVFFRTRSLSHVRDRLLIGDQSVSEVALDAGFEHLGRFASHYADTFGERPHDTLARARSTDGLQTNRPIARLAPRGPTAPRLGPLPA